MCTPPSTGAGEPAMEVLVLDWESKLQPFGLQAGTLTTKQNHPRWQHVFLSLTTCCESKEQFFSVLSASMEGQAQLRVQVPGPMSLM